MSDKFLVRIALLKRTPLSIGNRSVTYILYEDLHFHSYKVVLENYLKAWDFAQQVIFARPLKAIVEANDHLILVMSEETHCNIVNQENCRYWALENRRALPERY